MIKEINLVDAELYKKNPEILQDISYLRYNLKNLHEAGLNYIDFPQNIRESHIFTMQYFSEIEANKKEYKHIPKDLLKDQFFVSACLKSNPDIYLLADSCCHTEFAFKTLRKFHYDKYLKYANEKDLNSKEFCKEALATTVFNFKYMPKEFRADKEIILANLTERFARSSDLVRAEQIVKYIPEEVFEDRKFVKDMLDKNLDVFRFLPTSYKADEEIANNIVRKDSTYFHVVDKSLKKNKDFVFELLDYGDSFSNRFFSSERKFYNRHIIVQLDESYFTREFCEKHSSTIRGIYTEMDKQIRGNLEIIRSVYLFDSDERIEREYYQSRFLNKIPNEDLVKEIKDFVASTPDGDLFDFKSAPVRLVKLIDTFLLRKELNTELSSNVPTSKKMKL